MNPVADIIVPVWNSPVETRECLVALMAHSPGARLVLVDNGSDRETEALLEEFAEILGEGALLLRSETNDGFLRGVNRGMARTTAPWVVVLKNRSVVTSGWLEALLASGGDPETGILVPRTLPRGGRRTPLADAPREVVPESFDAVAFRRELVEILGSFDEELDGGVWSLRDFSRGGERNGFRTLFVPESVISCGVDPQFGSAARREETLRRSRLKYTERWGEPLDVLFFVPPGTDASVLAEALPSLLAGARLGHRFTVLADRGVQRRARKDGWHTLHGSILFEPLPLLRPRTALRNRVAGWREAFPCGVVISAVDGQGIVDAGSPGRLADIIATGGPGARCATEES